MEYHKHSHDSNIFIADSPSNQEDYAKRAVELGHKVLFTTEHGWGGDIFAYKEVADKYGLKCLFGIEGYIVPDVNSEVKDKRNYHIFIAPKTDKGRRKLNLLSSNANEKYFYYRPRFFLQELLELDRDGFIITTACIAGIVRDDDGIYKIFEPLLDHFRENVYLEIQPHVHPSQAEHNQKVLHLSKLYGVKLISGMDSHYIFPEDSKKRSVIVEGKGIKYEEKDAEDSFILDYPDVSTIYARYKAQGIVSVEDVKKSLDNTFVFEECEEIGINRIPKMPNIYKDKTSDERYQMLCDLSWKRFEDVIKEDDIKEEDIPKYRNKLQDCLNVVKETEELNTQDYFLINEKIVKLAVEKYGGVITRTGRGSGGAFYLNRVLGLTQLDSETTDIPIYPERFMSTARILENHSFPDIDMNVAEQEPFRIASKEILGEYGCVQMIAYGTMQLGEAFRNYCRSLKLPYYEYNEVAKNLERYENDAKWKNVIEESKKFVDTIISASIHPCSSVLMDTDIREELGLIHTSKGVVAPLTSDEADSWKYLKNDYLGAIVWLLISETFKELGRPIMTLRELKASTDDKTWEVYRKGLTCTVNQVDSDFGTSLSMRYKPKSIDEVAKLVAAMRPSFEPWRENFISRKPYTNHNQKMDELLEPTDHYILFQENIMQFFEWLNVSPAKSIGLIKKISKKKIKDSDFKELEEGLRESWIEKCGSIDGFDDNWKMIQSCMSYGFNCLSGTNNIWMLVNNKWQSQSLHQLYIDKLQYIAIISSKNTDVINNNSDFLIEYNTEKWIYSYDEENHVIKNRFDDIEYAGEKECLTIFFDNGKWVECTYDHKFPTKTKCVYAKDLVVGSKLLYANIKGRRKWVKEVRVVKIVKSGYCRTYFVSVVGPHHTFALSNGILSCNSPHALAYGYDSTYGAYLKSHYPLQYFSVALNIYEDDFTRTAKLIKEMSYYKIHLEGVKFGKSRSKYSYDVEKNTIYKSVKSVKYLNEAGAEELYELRRNSYETFVDLLYDIYEKTSLNSRAIEVLIFIDFFRDFGISKNLKFIFDKFVFYNKGQTSQVKKESIKDERMYKLFYDNSRETSKMFVDVDIYTILKEIERICNETNKEDYSVVDKMRFQEEYMGYISFNSNNPDDRFKLAILDIRDMKKKADGTIWARELDAISIGTSRRNKIIAYETFFKNHQLMKGDIIVINPKNLEKKIWNGYTNWYIKYYDIVDEEKVKI